MDQSEWGEYLQESRRMNLGQGEGWYYQHLQVQVLSGLKLEK
jgi:hypothetical protein